MKNQKEIFLILFIIILLCTIFYAVGYKNKSNSGNLESKFPFVKKIEESESKNGFTDLNQKKPPTVRGYKPNEEESPNYRYQNETQYNYNRLMDTVNKINEHQYKLSEIVLHETFTQSTTDDKMRMDLDTISKYVLLVLNEDKYFEFAKTNFGDVEMWTDKDGNQEIKYEIFLWELNFAFEVKLWVHILKFVDKEKMTHFGIRDQHYIFQYYNIGYPFKDQIIPPPDQVVVSGHFDLSNALQNVKPNEPAPTRFLYLNKIEIENSTLVVNYHIGKPNTNEFRVADEELGISGITDTQLEYIGVKGDHNPYLEKGRQYNQWIRLDEEPSWQGQYPSKPPPIDWDMDGVYYYSEDQEKPYCDKRKCYDFEPGQRASPDNEPLQPQYWASNYTTPINCGEYYWMFGLGDNNGSVSTTFMGGGKR